MVPLEFRMSSIIKPSFFYQPFKDFVESGSFDYGPHLVISKSPQVRIALSGWKRPHGILYILDFVYDSRHLGRIIFSEETFYFINQTPTYPTIFMDKMIEVSRNHPALMDFILWNLL